VNRPSKVLSDEDARRLWDIFNFFAEEEPSEEEDDISLFMDKQEVGLIIEKILHKIGKGFRIDEFQDLTEGTPAFRWILG
jgi:hypothetical protein